MNAVPAELAFERSPCEAGLDELERHRGELTRHCARMLGSRSDADDAVQETMLRAWRSSHRFEGRSTMRTWMYRIATNVCLDLRRGPQRRALVMDLGPASTAEPAAGRRPGPARVRPMAEVHSDPVNDVDDDVAEVIARRDSIRLAFVAAIQHLPPRQRAVLILFDVLRWRAREIAALLDTSAASVTSTLQRARITLAARDVHAPITLEAEQRTLLDRYVDAFARHDAPRLAALLRDEVVDPPVRRAAVDVTDRAAPSPRAGAPRLPTAGR